MLRDKKVIIGLVLLSSIWLARFIPGYLLDTDSVPNISVRFFEEPVDLKVIEVKKSITDPEYLAFKLSEPYDIPYEWEPVVLSGFKNDMLNVKTTVNKADSEGWYYITDIKYIPDVDYSNLSGNIYWEGAGGFYSYLVLVLSFTVPMLIAFAWRYSLPEDCPKKYIYLSNIAIWLTTSYWVNLVVFQQEGAFENKLAAVGITIFLLERYWPKLKGIVVPNYKIKYEQEKLARKYAEEDKEKFKSLIEGWKLNELKKLDMALYKMQFIPDLMKQTNDPETFKDLIFEYIEKANSELMSIKKETDKIEA